MATRILTVRNLDDVASSLSHPPIIVNDLKLETEEDRKYLESLTVTRYDSTDVLATVPSCLCRRTKEAHRLGQICEHCGTRVVSPHNKAIESDLWISVPHGIEYFLAPLPFIMMSQPLQARNFSGLAWALDPAVPAPDPSNKKGTIIVERFQKLGYKRGMRYLTTELPKLIDVAARTIPGASKRADLIEFMDCYKDALLVKHVPIPSKIAFVVEGTSVGNYYDKTMNALIEGVFASAGTGDERNIRKLETRFTAVLANICKYYQETVQTTLSGKSGWLRRVNYGNRMNFSFRNIITSEHAPHEYDTVRIPYHQLLACLRPMVVSKLMFEHNMCYRDAFDYVEAHANDRDPFLWELLEAMIDDTPEYGNSAATTVAVPDGKGGVMLEEIPSTLRTRRRTGGGIKVALTRYPSLSRSSTQGLRIVGLTECEIRLSVLALAGPNADFDKHTIH